MRRWSFIEPDDDTGYPVETVVTEAELMEKYYPWWQQQMIKAGKADLISPEHCIEDFVVVHWAKEL